MAAVGEGTVLLLPGQENTALNRPVPDVISGASPIPGVTVDQPQKKEPTPKKGHPAWKPPATQLTNLDGAVPLLISNDSFAPGKLHPFDKIKIAGTDIMVVASSVKAGTKLEVDKHKPHGADFPTVIGKGYDAEHTKFTIILLNDILSGTNWFQVYYDRIHDKLLPRELSERSAIDIYHPFLAADGINSLIVIERSTPYLVSHQIWHVDVEGIDTRFAQFKSTATKNKAKQMLRDPKVVAPTVLGQDRNADGSLKNGPAANQTGKP